MVKCELYLDKTKTEGFPGDPVVKNPPCNAGDIGLILVQEDLTYLKATKSLCHNNEPVPGAQEPQVPSPRSAKREATTMRSPRTTTRE